jgi:hypothetical protein
MTSEVIDARPARRQARRMTTTITSVVDTHLEAYGEPDADRRTTLLEAAWAPEGRLVDPPAVGEGRDGISALAEAVQQQFPGHRFRRSSAVDAHNDVLRYAWELVAPDGSVALAGVDVGQVGEDGRLRQVAGFFGELAAS